MSPSEKSAVLRAVMGFLAAPCVPVLLGYLFILVAWKTSDAVLEMALFLAAASYVLAFLVGIPAHLLLRRRRQYGLKPYLAVGATGGIVLLVAGMAAYLLASDDMPAWEMQSYAFLLLFNAPIAAFVGATISGCFWLIAVRSPARKQDESGHDHDGETASEKMPVNHPVDEGGPLHGKEALESGPPEKRNVLRILAGLLVAPALPAAMTYCVVLALDTRREINALVFGEAAVFFALACYGLAVLVGTPAYFVFQRRRMDRVKPYLALGAVTGSVASCSPVSPYGYLSDPQAFSGDLYIKSILAAPTLMVVAAFLGAAIGASFWLIAIYRPGRSSCAAAERHR